MIDIWENSIRATHLFLTSKEIDKIKEYIKNQLEEDYTKDQITLKEYIDPFTGNREK